VAMPLWIRRMDRAAAGAQWLDPGTERRAVRLGRGRDSVLADA
jgi:hypothetical protein